jgi:hypothetical protein
LDGDSERFQTSESELQPTLWEGNWGEREGDKKGSVMEKVGREQRWREGKGRTALGRERTKGRVQRKKGKATKGKGKNGKS